MRELRPLYKQAFPARAKRPFLPMKLLANLPERNALR